MTTYEKLTLVLSAMAFLLSVTSAIYVGQQNHWFHSSGFEAREGVKSETAKLLSSLRSIMQKSLITGDKQISNETKVISDFLTSQTALAYRAWISEKSAEAKKEGKLGEEWRTFYVYLAIISNAKTASREIAIHAATVELLLDDLTKTDIRRIASFNSDLTASIGNISPEGDVIATAYREIAKEQLKNNSDRSCFLTERSQEFL